MNDTITTRRLVLRRARMSDTDLLFGMFNNWNVVQWLASPEWPIELSGTRAYLERISSPDCTDEDYRVLVLEGIPIGGVSIRHEEASIVQSRAGPQIGYWLGEPFWGQGLMREAVEARIAAFFDETDEERLYSGVFDGNEASLRIQQRLGFAIEARAMMFCTPRQQEMLHVNTMLTRDAFERRRQS